MRLSLLYFSQSPRDRRRWSPTLASVLIATRGEKNEEKMKEIVEKAGLKGKAHFHLLRHTVASALARAGADPVSIQYMLGHANLSTTEIYLHPHRDAKRKAAELLEKQLPIGNLNGEKLALQG